MNRTTDKGEPQDDPFGAVRVQGELLDEDTVIVYIGDLTPKADHRRRVSIPNGRYMARYTDYTPSRGTRDRGVDYTLIGVCDCPDDTLTTSKHESHYYLIHKREWTTHEGEVETNGFVQDTEGGSRLTPTIVSAIYPALARAGGIELVEPLVLD